PRKVEWDRLTLEKGVLVFDSASSQLRMRTWSCVLKNMNRIEDLLNLAIRFAVPFSIFIRMKDLPDFAPESISEVEKRTLPGTLEPGFMETRLVWMGGENTRTSFLDLAAKMLRRPWAGIFLTMGGFANRIALWIDVDLPHRLAKGPSTRVTEYNRGFMTRGRVQSADGGISDEELLTRDQVSSDELNLLFGYIDKGHPNSDVYLFPPQWLLEK
ncbi:hypothetical protein DFH09DRAFT_822722, partial [Mycena vulgaris]